MKFLFAIMGASLLISCSQQNKPSSIPESIFEFNAGIGIFTGNAEFGTLKKTDSKVITLKVTNTGDAPLQGPPSLDNTNFSIIYQNGCASIAPTKSCSMKVSFDAKGKAPGIEYVANLNLDSTFLELKGSIEAAPPLVPCCGYIFSQTQVDFGPVPTGKTIVKTLSIKNTEAPFLVAPISVPSDFLLVYDTCSSKTIPKGGSCSFKVALRGIDKADIRRGGIVNGSIIILGQTITLAGELLESNDISAPVAVSNVVSIVNNLEVTAVNAGSLSGSNSKQIIFNLKNTGNAPAPVSTASLNNSNASILFNQCVNKVLAPNSSCQVRVVVSASGKNNDSYSSILSFGDKSTTVSFLVGQVAEVITYAPTYGEFGSCSATLACAGTGTKSRTISSCQKLSNGNPVAGGQLSDCSSFNVAENLEASCLSPAGEIQSTITGGTQTLSCLEGSSTQTFVSVSCDSGYVKNGEVCQIPVITQVTNLNIPAVIGSSLECGVSYTSQFTGLTFDVPLRIKLDQGGGPFFYNFDTAEKVTDNSACTNNNTTTGYFPTTRSLNHRMEDTGDFSSSVCYANRFSSGGSAVGFPIPEQEVFEPWFGDQNCDDIVNQMDWANRSVRSINTTISPAKDEIIMKEIKVSGNKEFIVDDNNRTLLSKDIISDSQLPTSIIKTHTEVAEAYDISEINNEIIVYGRETINDNDSKLFRYNSSLDLFQNISYCTSVDVINECRLQSIRRIDNTLFVEYFNQVNGIFTLRKTINGQNFETVTTGYLSHNILQESSQILGDYMYYLNQNQQAQLRRVNLITGANELVVGSYSIYNNQFLKIKNSLFFTTWNGTNHIVYKISSNHTIANVYSAPLAPPLNIYAGNNHLFFKSGSNIIRINESTNIVVTYSNYAQGCSESVDTISVNQFSDSISYYCRDSLNSGVIRSAMINLIGTKTFVPFEGYRNYRSVNAYKNKTYLNGYHISDPSKVYLIEWDSNDVFTLKNIEVREKFSIENDTFYFTGKNPAGKLQLFKYYSN